MVCKYCNVNEVADYNVKRNRLICEKCKYARHQKKYQTSPKGKQRHLENNTNYNKSEKGRITRKVTKHNRRARIKQTGGKLDSKSIKMLLDKFDYRCARCLDKTSVIHLDHIVPLAKNGSNDINNIQPLCAFHNLEKHTNIADYREAALQAIQYIRIITKVNPIGDGINLEN